MDYRLAFSLRFLARGEVPTWLLIKWGLKVGRNFHRMPGCWIDGCCWLITIGDNVTLAPKVQILAHDASTKNALGVSRVGTVEIGNSVFVGLGSIVLPNVKIGNNVIIGAGSVVTKNIPDNTVVAGNPARVIGSATDTIEKNRALMKSRPCFTWPLRPYIGAARKHEMKERLADGVGYID